MIDAISQAWVSIFGLTALLCMVSKPIRARRAGVILGLIGQPGWYAQLVIHEQWGMLPVFAGYTLVWILGLFTLWINPALDHRRNPNPPPAGPPPVSQMKPFRRPN